MDGLASLTMWTPMHCYRYWRDRCFPPEPEPEMPVRFSEYNAPTYQHILRD